MGKVRLMDGVTVSENLLKANWPNTIRHTTFEETVVRAAEEVKRRFGIIPFPIAEDYFAAVHAVRNGDSPIAAVVLNSQGYLDDVDQYGKEVRRHRRVYSKLASRRGAEIRTIPPKRDTIRGKDIKWMKSYELHDRNARRHYTRVRSGITTTELPYTNVTSLPKSLRERVLSEYPADHADFILEVLKRHKGLAIGQMMNLGVFVPDIENRTLYFIDANVESLLADQGLNPSEFHRYGRLGVLNYTSIGRGFVLVTAGEDKIGQRPLDTSDVYSDVRTPRGMKSVVVGEPPLVHLKAVVEANLFRGRYRDTPPTPNPIDHAPLH